MPETKRSIHPLPVSRPAVLAVALGGALCAGAQTPDPALEQGLQLLEEARTTLDDKALAAAQDYFRRLTEQHPNAAYFYERGRANFYRCEADSSRNDKKHAERVLDEAIANVEQSLKLNERSADAHSLLADLYGRKITFGSTMIRGPQYGPKLKAENKRALELDANDPRVYDSLGRQYLNAPSMFGGDVDKAIESFRRSARLDPKSDETFVWLAIALRKQGDATGANQAIAEALRLNPRSAFARKTQAKK